MYKRLTKDVYYIYGWYDGIKSEEYSTEDRKDRFMRLREYRENCPSTRFTIDIKRERI